MTQDSCDDEHEEPDPPSPNIKTPGTREATIGQKQQQPSEPSFYKQLTFWNVVSNFLLAGITVFLGFIAYWQLQSSHLEQRAWVGMKEMRMKTLNGDAPIRVDVKFTNLGKTPAFDINLAMGVFVRAPGPTTWMDDRTQRARSNHPVIFPGLDTYEITQGEVRPSQEDLDIIKTGKKVLYVVGEIEYRDVFRDSHITEFCGIFMPERGVFYSCNEHQRAT